MNYRRCAAQKAAATRRRLRLYAQISREQSMKEEDTVTTLIEPHDVEVEREATERNANVAEPIRAIVNGIATLIPMDVYAAGVIKSIEKAFKK